MSSAAFSFIKNKIQRCIFIMREFKIATLIYTYLTLIKRSLPHFTDTTAFSPGSTSLLMPYWYSQEISASANGYFAPLMVMPLAQPVIFKSEKKEYLSQMETGLSETISISE